MLDILFPESCYCCLDSLPNNQKICDACCDDMKYVVNWSLCRTCGVPFGFFNNGSEQYSQYEIQSEGALCAKCIKDFYSFYKARSIAIYQGNIRDLIISFKYEGKLNRAYSLIEILVSNYPNDLDKFDCIVPVPLHIDKLRNREYNQSVILAQGLAKHMGVECDLFGLKRIRDTKPQIGITNETERMKNVRGAFSVSKNSGFKDKSLLLVDDVFTTGSTSDECSKMLLKSGAYKVQVLTLTRAWAM